MTFSCCLCSYKVLDNSYEIPDREHSPTLTDSPPAPPNRDQDNKPLNQTEQAKFATYRLTLAECSQLTNLIKKVHQDGLVFNDNELSLFRTLSMRYCSHIKVKEKDRNAFEVSVQELDVIIKLKVQLS